MLVVELEKDQMLTSEDQEVLAAWPDVTTAISYFENGLQRTRDKLTAARGTLEFVRAQGLLPQSERFGQVDDATLETAIGEHEAKIAELEERVANKEATLSRLSQVK